jgi:fructose PTS system EIIBC or EIIC component
MNLDLIDMELEGNTRDDVIEEMVKRLHDSGSLTSKADLNKQF